MLITSILDIIFNIFSGLLSNIHLPSLDSNWVDASIEQLQELFDMTSEWIGVLFPWQTVSVILPIVIAIVFFKEIYDFVMWILRKIPVLGIE